MIYTNNITSKGQITIPKAFRDRILGKSRQAIITMLGDAVIIKRPKTIEEIRAMVGRPSGKDPLTKREKLIGPYLAKKYGVR